MTVTLDSLRGRVGDLDSHESIPAALFSEAFGEGGRRFRDELPRLWQAVAENVRANMAVYKDTARARGEALAIRNAFDPANPVEISQETVWTIKGEGAPGAADMDRRIAVMDEMGIQRQLIFPMMGLLAWGVAQGGGRIWIPKFSQQEMDIGKQAVKAYNQWAGRLTRKHPDRMWVVGILRSDDPELTPNLLIEQAEELIDNGCRALQLSSGTPPAGLSPGDRKLDPFYELLAKNNVTMTFHPPSGGTFRSSNIWESTMLNHRYSTVNISHAAEETFLATMILSGVFDRHPTLRVAFVETGADWIGPLAERMDWGPCQPLDHSKLSMKPSEYLARNVRVSTMVGERVEVWLERWPHLQDVYCYASDYPHIEGGQWSLKRLHERLAPLGDDILEKFFVTNSKFVLPEAA